MKFTATVEINNGRMTYSYESDEEALQDTRTGATVYPRSEKSRTEFLELVAMLWENRVSKLKWLLNGVTQEEFEEVKRVIADKVNADAAKRLQEVNR